MKSAKFKTLVRETVSFGSLVLDRISTKCDKERNRALTKKIISEIPEVKNNSSGVIFIYSPHRANIREEFYTVLIREFAKLQIESYFLASGTVYNFYKPRLMYLGKEISNTLSVHGFPTIFRSKIFKGQSFEWKKNLEKEEFFIDGINFFHIIKSSLSSAHKRFNIDFNNPHIARQVDDLALSCDVLLNYFRAFKKIASDQNKKIRIIITQFIDLPNSAFKFLADNEADDSVQCISALPALNKYYFMGDAKNWYYIISNLNKRKQSIGVEVSPDELKSVKSRIYDVSEVSKSIEKAIGRSLESPNLVEQDYIKRIIDDYKRNGKKIFVLFGHLFYDMAVIDSSPVFKDLCEWIRKTIEYFNQDDNLLLLKPHPSETSRYPDETLEKYAAQFTKSDNIKILGASTFSLYDISRFMDCGLIWTSSVAMELTYLGVPCIITGVPVYKSLPLNYAANSDDYFRMIKTCDEIKITAHQKELISCYTYYLEKIQPHYLPQVYGSGWHRKNLQSYLQSGDNDIDTITRRFIDEV